MGHKVSREKAHVVVSLREGLCRLDTLTVSYRSSGCLGRRRQVASFTFPSTDWRCYGGVAACKAQGGLCVPLAALTKKDPSMAVQLRCSKGRHTLLKAAMPLGEFIDNLDFIHFSLRCDAKDSRGGYTSMRGYGRSPVEAARPPARHQPSGVDAPSDPSKASTVPAGDGSVITKATTAAGDANTITKATTSAGDDSVITKAATPAGDAKAITKAPTPAGDDITTAVTSAGDDITTASSTKNGDASTQTPASWDELDGVKEASMMTPPLTCEVSYVRERRAPSPDSNNQGLRRRKKKTPTRRTHDRVTAVPRTPVAPYTFTDAFLEVTAISVVFASIALMHYWLW